MAIWSKKPAEKKLATPDAPTAQPEAAAPLRESEGPAVNAAAANGHMELSSSPTATPDGKVPSDRGAIDPATVDIQLGAAFASIVRVMLRSAQYRQLPIAELERRVLPAVRSRQFFIAQRRHARTGVSSPLGFVIWASVSDTISSQFEAVTGPRDIVIPFKEWRSGSNVWMLDALGQTAIMGKMLETLAQSEWKGRQVKARVHTADGNVAIRLVQR